jgi:glycosyltransferase involved in cell wall biosynthesis
VKILFTSTLRTSFILEDLHLLSKHFNVRTILTRGPGSLLRLALEIWKVDVTFTWFASSYAFFVVWFAKAMSKRSILVVGGVDVAKYPEMKYGIWLNPLKAMLVRSALRSAYRVLAVDPFQQREAARLANYDGANIEYVPTGYDSSKWYPSGTKKEMVLTVAHCHNLDRFKLKGLDILFNVAKRMPQVTFLLVGLLEEVIEEADKSRPENLTLKGFVAQSHLLHHYRESKVYCQPSFMEGLPNSLCEAMLCECIPVASSVGGIPTAIGDAGFLVPYGEVQQLSRALRQALDAPASLGKSARERIASTFPLIRREESLLRIIQGTGS